MELNELIIAELKNAVIMHNPEAKINFSNDTRIIGKNGVLDSLAFVTFVVALEQKINSDMTHQISLQDEKAFSQTKSPFRTVNSLSLYIRMLIKEKTK